MVSNKIRNHKNDAESYQTNLITLFQKKKGLAGKKSAGRSLRGVGRVASLCRGQPLWECPDLNISICLAGFAGVLGERGFWSQWGGSGPLIPVPLLGLPWDAG